MHIVFDVDGVILNSNKLKTLAFATVLRDRGLLGAEMLMEFNKQNGGVSALEKFEYYCASINPQCPFPPAELEREFRSLVKAHLPSSEVDGFFRLKRKPRPDTFHIITGGNRDETVEVLKQKEIYGLFDGQILGGPTSKPQNFSDLALDLQGEKVCYIGDSRLDYELTCNTDWEFVFVTQWTEFLNWKSYFADKDLRIVRDLSEYFGVRSSYC